jgi:gamma-glutamyltranspeptidase/glutathione hydrolase
LFYYFSDHVTVPVSELLSKQYSDLRRKLFDPTKATIDHIAGTPVNSCDTVSFCAVDKEGNACSFINSIYCN